VLDKENGNDLWCKAITKEMKNTNIAFMYLDEGKKYLLVMNMDLFT
jgi:hypothetical protein